MPCAKPRPTALKKVVRADAPISEFRNLYCRHYGACIDVAVRAGWESFTCARCPFFHTGAKPEASEHAFDQPGDMGITL